MEINKMADIKKFIEEVKNMTVLELNELVKALEEEFGVSAAAPVAVAAAPAAGAAPLNYSRTAVAPAALRSARILSASSLATFSLSTPPFSTAVLASTRPSPAAFRLFYKFVKRNTVQLCKFNKILQRRHGYSPFVILI